MDTGLADALVLDAMALADALWLMRIRSTQHPHDTSSPSSRPGPAGAAAAPASYRTAVPVDAPAADELQDDAPGDVTHPRRTPIRPAAPAARVNGAPGAPLQARIGALRALPDVPAMRRALRQFSTRPDRPSGLIDEAATVEQYIGSGATLSMPVMQRASRRWLSLSLVVEASGTNALWSQAVDEFARLTQQQGIFRQVSRWAWNSGVTNHLTLQGRHGAFGASAQHFSSIRFRRHELVLVISDFTTPVWRSGTLTATLERHARTQPLVLVHTLPSRLWHRSWVGRPDGWANAPVAAAASAAMQVQALHGHIPVISADHIALPILPLGATALARLGHALMMPGAAAVPMLFPAMRTRLLPGPRPHAGTDSEALQRVRGFQMASSPPARRLAQYMALTAPLTFPIMRWVQAAMLPGSDSAHLAEFVLGGLLRKAEAQPDVAADDVVYTLDEEVREHLQHGMPIASAIDVLQTVGEYLEAHQHGTVDGYTGITVFPDEHDRSLPASLQAFAAVSNAFLERIGVAPRPTVPARAPATNASTAAMMVEERARTLAFPVLDIQWSPGDESLLAILHDGGVELWDVVGQEQGKGKSVLLAPVDADGAVRGAAAPFMLYWSAGLTGDAAGMLDARMHAVLHALWQEMIAFGYGPVSVAPLPRNGEDGTASLPACAVILFENLAWSDPLPDVRRQYPGDALLLVAAVRLDNDAAPVDNAEARVDLSPRALASMPEHAGATGPLDSLIRALFSRLIFSSWFDSVDRSCATAIAWRDRGHLAICRRTGAGNELDLIDGRGVLKGNEARSQRGYPRTLSDRTVTQIKPFPPHAHSTKLKQPWVWVDSSGTCSIGGVAQGIDHGALGMLCDTGTSVAMTGPGVAVHLVDGATLRAAPLEPVRAGSADAIHADGVFSYPPEHILAIYTDHDKLLAVTSARRLFAGSTSSQNPDEGHSPFAEMAPPPPARAGQATAACFFPPDGALCILLPDGTLELWNGASLTDRLDQAVPVTMRPDERPVLRAAPSRQLIAVSQGARLLVFRLMESRHGLLFARPDASAGTHILWVDDRPDNNIHERTQLMASGAHFMLTETTNGALNLLERFSFAAVISDMGRREGTREGYVLLDAMRARGDETPVFFYAGSNSAPHRAEALRRGAQGSTNQPHDLFALVRSVLLYEA